MVLKELLLPLKNLKLTQRTVPFGDCTVSGYMICSLSIKLYGCLEYAIRCFFQGQMVVFVNQ